MPITSIGNLITINNAEIEVSTSSIFESRSAYVATTTLSNQKISQIVAEKLNNHKAKLNMTPIDIENTETSVKTL